jgi:hypothetical protein
MQQIRNEPSELFKYEINPMITKRIAEKGVWNGWVAFEKLESLR